MDNKNLNAFGFAALGDGEAIVADRLSKREYFATHAPDAPQWFEPKMPEPPKRPLSFDNVFGIYSNHRFKMTIEKYYDSEHELWNSGVPVPEELKQEIKLYNESWTAFKIADEIYRKSYLIEKIIQWRWYYADMMLREQPKDESAKNDLPF